MTETILEIKNLKKSYGKNEVLKDISLSVKKGQGNQPSFALLTYLSHPQVVKSSIMGTTSLKKVTTSLPIVKDSVWFSNPSTSLKTLMSWKMLS